MILLLLPQSYRDASSPFAQDKHHVPLTRLDRQAFVFVVSSKTDGIVTVDDGENPPLNYQIVKNHAWVLLRILQDVDGNDIMELFNPHGGDPTEPLGGWPNPITSPMIEVPLEAFNTYFRRFQWQ